MDRETARDLMARLNRDAERIALRFRLRYQSIEAERPQVKSRYGICYSDGRIRIRLRHATTGRALRYSSLVNTLCHELAHLRHMNHGPRFKTFYLNILDWARREGIYRPGIAEGATISAPPGPAPRTRVPAVARASAQLTLF
jgi:predicted metal-dependent hydrolase